METEHTELLEILPANIGSLPSTEAAPLLNRAASRIDIVRPKSEFWNGMKENLRGAGGFIEAQKAKFKGRTLNLIAGAALVTTMVSACSKPPETPYLPTEAPRVTETIPTEMPLPTETPTQTPTQEQTPTLEVTPTPTEIPLIYPNDSDDIRELWARNEITIETYNRKSIDLEGYYIDIKAPIRLAFIEQASSDTYDMVWGFKIGENSYFFRVLGVEHYSLPMVGGQQVSDVNPSLSPFVAGDYGVGLGFFGLTDPLDTEWDLDWLGPTDITPSARSVYGALRTDEGDMGRLIAFFESGDNTGLPMDKQGIVDLRNVIVQTGGFPLPPGN